MSACQEMLPDPIDMVADCLGVTCPCERIEAPPHAIWRDDFEEFGPDRWAEADTAWEAPQLELGDGRRLVLEAPDPFPEEEWAVAGLN